MAEQRLLLRLFQPAQAVDRHAAGHVAAHLRSHFLLPEFVAAPLESEEA